MSPIRRDHHPILQLQPTTGPAVEDPCLGSPSKPPKVKQMFKPITSKYLKFRDAQTTGGNLNPGNKQTQV